MTEYPSMQTSVVPSASDLMSSPLRNLIRVELDASVEEVWGLIGDLSRFPEYSPGLEKVDAKLDSNGSCIEYVCHFEPREEGGEGLVHREIMRWYEPNRGFASIAEEPNAFGLTSSLTMVTLEPSKAGTIVTFAQCYEAEDLDAMKAEFDQALAGQAENLIASFGGSVTERYVET